MTELKVPTPIECPACAETLEESASASILASLRCGGCGRMLAFDEVLALRETEQARARKYD